MIEPQVFMTLEDKERGKSSILIARDVACLQFYQVPLIDAFVSMADYLPEYPSFIVPVEHSSQDNIFMDTFFIKEVGTPNAVIFDKDVLRMLVPCASDLLSPLAFERVCDGTLLNTLQEEHGLLLVGVYVPLPEQSE